MRKALLVLAALAASPALVSCQNSPGGVLTSSQLTAAQNAAGNVYALIKAQAASYVALPGVTPSQAATVNLAVQALGAAVSAFQGVSSLGNVEQAAQAFLTAAAQVVALIPSIDPTTKLEIESAIGLAQVLLPVVVPSPAPPQATASGPL